MPNLQFLRVYKSQNDGNDIVHIPEEMEFPRRLRLLHWEKYPSKCLPSTFHLECLVELKMVKSNLKYLWKGIQPLPNLKKIDLSQSTNLKKLPDFSKAANVKSIDLSGCESLEEIPISFSHLHKLEMLTMWECISLKVIPVNMNLASLEGFSISGCSRLRNIPVMSTNITILWISETAIEDVSASSSMWSRLVSLTIMNNGKLREIIDFPKNVQAIDLRDSYIERISDIISVLNQLYKLDLSGCRRLVSLPQLPRSLKVLSANDCESLETVFSPLNIPYLSFMNCFKLSQQSRRAITQQCAILPGREVPAVFKHRARRNSLIIRPDGNPYHRFVVCLVISKLESQNSTQNRRVLELFCRRIGMAKDDFDPFEKSISVCDFSGFRSEHLFVFDSELLGFDPSDMSREIMFEFNSHDNDFEIMECGARILTKENGNDESGLDQVLEEVSEFELNEAIEDDGGHANKCDNET